MNIRQRLAEIIGGTKGISRDEFWAASSTRADRTRGTQRSATNYDSLSIVAKMQGYANSIANKKARDCANVPVRVYRRRVGAGTVGRSLETKAASRKAYQHLNSGNAGAKAAEWASLGGELEEVIGGPILEFVANPNPDYTGGQASRAKYLDQFQAGSAYDVRLDPKDNGGREGVYRLDPVVTRPVPHPDTGIVVAFLYGRETQNVQEFEAAEVFWYRHDINPRDPYDGWSPPRDVLDQLDLLAAHFANELGFVENGLRPDSVFSLPAGTTKDQRDAFQAMLEQRHRGVSKRPVPLITTGDVTVTTLGWAPKDLLTTEMRESMYRDIRNAFGYPESMADLNDANLASSKMGFDRQWAGEIRQAVNAQSEQETRWWPPAFGFEPGEVVVIADDPMPDAVVELADRHVKLVSAGVLTINEARAEQGMDEAEDEAADQLRINGQSLEALDREQPEAFGFGPSPFGGPSPTPTPSVTVNDDDDAAAAAIAQGESVQSTAMNGAQIASLLEIVEQVTSGKLNIDAALAVARASFPGMAEATIMGIFGSIEEGGQDDDEPGPVATVARWLKGVPDRWAPVCDHEHESPLNPQRGTRSPLESPLDTKAGDLPPDILNLDDADILGLTEGLEKFLDGLVVDFLADPSMSTQAKTDQLAKLIEPELERIMAESAFSAAGISGDPSDLADVADQEMFSVVHERMLEAVKVESAQLAGQVTETTVGQLENALQRGIEDGRSVVEIGKEIEGADFSRTRAQMIARTELAKASTAGELVGFKARGVTHKIWKEAPGRCPICAAIAKNTDNGGAGIPIDEPFHKGGPLSTAEGTKNVWPSMGPPAHPNCRCRVGEV